MQKETNGASFFSNRLNKKKHETRSASGRELRVHNDGMAWANLRNHSTNEFGLTSGAKKEMMMMMKRRRW
jgi:P pilus assembly chaperone PapD